MAVTAKLEGNVLTITATLDGKEKSSSGKNIVLATTGGFVVVTDGIRYALNVIKKE